jgi:DNA ligase-1
MNPLRPMLAIAADEQYLQAMRYPVLASPKIDGVRAMVVNSVVTSRSGKPIPNRYVQSKYGIPQLNGYDGELVVGSPVDKNCMQRTTSGVMSHDGQPSVTFWVFDRWDIANEPYFERLGAITEIPELQAYRLNHEAIHSYDALQRYESLQTSGGYEGVMLRGYNNKYKHGRSTLREGGLIKVKRFYDSEAVVIGYEPLYRNENAAVKNELGYTERSTHQANKYADDLLGSLTVKDLKTRVTFEIGSGFDMSQRELLWKDPNKLIGRIVKYKSFSVGVVDKPRFPIFLGFRDPLDM